MRKTLRIFLPTFLAIAVLTAAIAAPAVAGERVERRRERLLEMVNRFRGHAGIGRLNERPSLSDDAQQHSWKMANQRRLFHSTDLYRTVSSFHPNAWGENVGYGPTLRSVFRAWKRSPSHRANLVDRRFDLTGIGIYRAGGRFWITMNYCG